MANAHDLYRGQTRYVGVSAAVVSVIVANDYVL